MATNLIYDKFSGMSPAEQRILIHIGRTVPSGSSISDEMLMEELLAFPNDANFNLTEQDFRTALDNRVDGYVTEKNGRYSIDNDTKHFIEVTLPEKWREMGLLP